MLPKNYIKLHTKTSQIKCELHLHAYYMHVVFIKGGYAHSNMHMFHFYLIDLDLWNAFCEVSPWGSFLFTLQRQKKVCTPGDEAIMKIHKKLVYQLILHFLLYLQNYKEFEAEILDLQSEKYGLSFDIKKYTTSGWALGDENMIGIRAFKLDLSLNNDSI